MKVLNGGAGTWPRLEGPALRLETLELGWGRPGEQPGVLNLLVEHRDEPDSELEAASAHDLPAVAVVVIVVP